ncbi:hypothetical protein M4J06_003160 [Streptomyces coelicoflavus]|uniref:hypothetical protein n=1 Tax=Streptomyces coelicoflavus TaxID=285562 RepID=UPI002109776D|nr:hypothetical protein [Streptomyces coelicoflavus]MCQ4204839.1 hypothetical protein [Streptomyces coelicoflavus]
MRVAVPVRVAVRVAVPVRACGPGAGRRPVAVPGPVPGAGRLQCRYDRLVELCEERLASQLAPHPADPAR